VIFTITSFSLALIGGERSASSVVREPASAPTAPAAPAAPAPATAPAPAPAK